MGCPACGSLTRGALMDRRWNPRSSVGASRHDCAYVVRDPCASWRSGRSGGGAERKRLTVITSRRLPQWPRAVPAGVVRARRDGGRFSGIRGPEPGTRIDRLAALADLEVELGA